MIADGSANAAANVIAGGTVAAAELGPDVALSDGDVVPEVFRLSVARTPDAIAVVADGAALRYSELDSRSDTVATRLAAAGLRPESVVAICLPPSADIVVAMLGVLKAGAAYTPIDPDYPAHRVRTLLAEAGPAAVLTNVTIAATLPALTAPVLTIGQLAEPDPGGSRRPLPALTGDNAACVIFTSGSTGVPKGVVITHRGLVNLASAAIGRFGLRHSDRFLQLASVSFSAFLEEVFPSLLGGSTVVLAGYRRALTSIPRLLEILGSERITGFGITTAHWHELVHELRAGGARLPPTVRFVLMGGEAARRDLVRAWPACNVPLVHVYGPTEVTATATYLHTGSHDLSDGQLPIGKVIQNTSVWLLDNRMRLVPDGTPGEMFIGGTGLARGYHRRPGATATRFVGDPYGPRGGRLYRTGDLARRLPDGNLEFLGRLDSQIKIRGYRIEPGEIELALTAHPGVRAAAVVTRDTAPLGLRLCAYLIPAGDPPDVGTLRSFLAGRLPDYLVPSEFAVVDALPLTPNGKVNREALVAITGRPLAPAAGYLSPDGQVEQRIAHIYAEVLGVGQVSATDDFFALGGHSLLTTRVLGRITRELGCELDAEDLFAARTVRALAAIVTSREHGPPDPERAARADARDGGPPRWRARRTLINAALVTAGADPRSNLLSLSQEGLWMLSQLTPDVALYSVPVRIVIGGMLDIGALERAVTSVVARHGVLHSRFGTVDGHAVQVDLEPGQVPLPVRDLAGLQPAERARQAAAAALAEAARPFDLTTGPVFRAAVTRHSDDEHELLINAHHLVFDGLSVALFLDGLGAGYKAQTGSAAGPAPGTAGRPADVVQYADFGIWQRERMRGQRRRVLAEYWAGRLDGAPPLLALPADGHRRADSQFRGDGVRVALPLRQRDALGSLARATGTTPFITGLAAFIGLMHRLSEQEDVCVGVPAANRVLPEFEAVVGYFVNALVIRVSLRDDPTMSELVQRTAAACLGAIRHQELPFDLLVADLRPDRVPGANPLFQVSFALDDAPGLGSSLPGLRILRGSTVSTGRAPFDLAWLMENHGDTWEASVEYSADLFGRDRVVAMIAGYGRMVEAITSEQARRVSAVPLA